MTASTAPTISAASSTSGQLLRQEPLARYTSWRIGGPAERLYLPADLNDLSHFIQQLPDQEPITWLGLGSNTLVRDGGISGTVIITQGRLNQLQQRGDAVVYAEAGVSCASFARFCARLGFTDMEFLATIPGTIGGALAMNAGAYGIETWNLVKSLQCLDHQGQIQHRSPSDYRIAYREVIPPAPEWFVAAEFNLRQGQRESSLQRIRDLLAQRTATQPTSEYSCGSVFRNPPGDYAGRLIEACGLKGFRHGGASVSTKHGNFIINDQQAKASEVEELIALLQQRVADRFGIELQREVHIIGQAK